MSRSSGLWDISVARHETASDIQADILIDATGRAASISKRLGARPIVYDELIGIVGRVTGPSPQHSLLLIEAVELGWWYSAGLADGTIIATFLTDPDLVDTSKSGRLASWQKQLAASDITASRVVANGDDLHIRTARTQRLDVTEGEGWLAVGDAAISFDPLSSDGISKGARMGEKGRRAGRGVLPGRSSGRPGLQASIERRVFRLSRHAPSILRGRATVAASAILAAPAGRAATHPLMATKP